MEEEALWNVKLLCLAILDELADAVGGYDYVSTEPSDRATYGVDYFWVSRMWQDRGQVPPMPDWSCALTVQKRFLKY